MKEDNIGYKLFYFVEWPDFQVWESLDTEGKYTCSAVIDDEPCMFVDKEWADDMRNILQLDI